jgi:hypothetical protein
MLGRIDIEADDVLNLGIAIVPSPSALSSNYPSPPHMLLRAVPRSDHGGQPFAVARTKPDFNAFSHPNKFAHSQTYGNLSSASIH